MPVPKCVISVFCKQSSYIDVKQAPKTVIHFRGYRLSEAQFEISFYRSNYPAADAPLVDGIETDTNVSSLLDLSVPVNAITTIAFDRHEKNTPFYFVDKKYAEALTEVVITGYDISKHESHYTRAEMYLSKHDRILFNLTQRDYYEFLDNLLNKQELIARQVAHAQTMVSFKNEADQALLAKAEAERAFHTAAEKSKVANTRLRQQENIKNTLENEIARIEQGLENVIFVEPVKELAPRLVDVVIFDEVPKHLRGLTAKSKACSIM